MPRLSYVTSQSFIKGEQKDEPLNENLDFCTDCWQVGKQDDYIPNGLDPKFVDEECEHPPYEDTDYKCTSCNKPLGEEDN